MPDLLEFSYLHHGLLSTATREYALVFCGGRC